jgi:hypothetical protein
VYEPGITPEFDKVVYKVVMSIFIRRNQLVILLKYQRHY